MTQPGVLREGMRLDTVTLVLLLALLATFVGAIVYFILSRCFSCGCMCKGVGWKNNSPEDAGTLIHLENSVDSSRGGASTSSATSCEPRYCVCSCWQCACADADNHSIYYVSQARRLDAALNDTVDDDFDDVLSASGTSQVTILSVEAVQSTGNEVCPICLDEFTSDECNVIALSCCHSYHEKCIAKWIREREAGVECPLCKRSVEVARLSSPSAPVNTHPWPLAIRDPMISADRFYPSYNSIANLL